MFLPIRIASEGGEIGMVGTVLFLIMLASTISMVLIGKIADKWGKKRVLQSVMVLSPLFLLAGRFSGGWPSILFFMIGTAAINTTLPITGAIAQEMVPSSRGMASSIVMGLSWGFGNMLMAPLGKIGDLFGVQTTLLVVALLPLAALPLLCTKSFRETAE